MGGNEHSTVKDPDDTVFSDLYLDRLPGQESSHVIVKPYETDETIAADYPLHAPRKGLCEREEVWILRSGSPTIIRSGPTDGVRSPERRTQSVYADIVADFLAQGTESMRVHIDGMKPATLRAGLRRALKGKEGEGVRLTQRGEGTYLVRTAGN